MSEYFSRPVIVYASTLDIARRWATANVYNTNRRPITASPQTPHAFLGIRNSVIICVDALVPEDRISRVIGHENLLITVAK